jgi:hypothetical protein
MKPFCNFYTVRTNNENARINGQCHFGNIRPRNATAGSLVQTTWQFAVGTSWERTSISGTLVIELRIAEADSTISIVLQFAADSVCD